MLQIFVIVFPFVCAAISSFPNRPSACLSDPQCLRLDWEKPELPKMLMGRLKSLLEGQTWPDRPNKNPTCTAVTLSLWSAITVVFVVTRQL